METLARRHEPGRFQFPETSLGDIDVREAARLVAASADLALVIDSRGVIRDLAISNPDVREYAEEWIGKRWIDTVTVESRPKIESLLADAAQGGMPRWRQVNHPGRKAPDLPVLYAAIPVGRGDAVVAVGRDLSTLSSLQQKLIDAQQSMEREYARLRNAETRYRLLFQLASEAVISSTIRAARRCRRFSRPPAAVNGWTKWRSPIVPATGIFWSPPRSSARRPAPTSCYGCHRCT
jgi:hypothetical protein